LMGWKSTQNFNQLLSVSLSKAGIFGNTINQR